MTPQELVDYANFRGQDCQVEFAIFLQYKGIPCQMKTIEDDNVIKTRLELL